MRIIKIQIKQTPKVKEYNSVSVRALRVRHVIKHPKGGWSVVRVGASKGRIFSTKVEAVNNAKSAARRENSRVVIHKKDGKIQKID